MRENRTSPNLAHALLPIERTMEKPVLLCKRKADTLSDVRQLILGLAFAGRQ